MTGRNLSAAFKVVANQNIKDRDYWLKKLAGDIEKSYFPYDKEPTGQTGQKEPSFAYVSFGFPGEMAARLLELTRQSDYALHIYLAAGVTLLLHHYTGMTDILVATPIYKQDIERELINRVILLQNQLRDNMTVKELLIDVKQTITEAIEHQNYPLEMLPEQLNLSNDEEDYGFPLFDTAMLLENLQDKKYLAQINHNMRFSFSRNDCNLMGNIEYNSHLYDKAAVERIGRHFIELMQQALENLDSSIARLGVLPAEEKQKNIKVKRLSKKKERGVLIPPSGPYQEKLAEIWSEILEVEKERIGIDSNFFKMGGHSLKAAAMVARVHQAFDIRVPLAAVFAAPTIQALAERIGKSREKEVDPGKNKYTAVKAVEKKQYYAMSSAQRRVFILDQKGSDISYNMHKAVKIQGTLNIGLLEKTFQCLVKRHESLRTSFHWQEGEPVQWIAEDLTFRMEYYQVNESVISSQVIENFVRPFDLSNSPLFRVRLIKQKHHESEHILLFDMHHIISDGTSIEILVREFFNLYAGHELPCLRIQYKDFSRWESIFSTTPVFKAQEKFWLKYLNGELPRLRMPLDFKRPEKQIFDGKEVVFTIPGKITKKLNAFAKEKGVTLNILVLSVYFLLVFAYSNQEDIIVGSVVSGRNHVDLENIMGMFGNFLPIRCRVDPGTTFADFLETSRERILAAYENQDYPLEKIVDLLNFSVDISRNPLFDTMVAFHSELDSLALLKIGDLEFKNYPLIRQAAKLDFKLDVFINAEDELYCTLEYNPHLFKAETIEGFARHFQCLINEVIDKPARRIADIHIFTNEEKLEMSRKRELDPISRKKSVQLTVSATFTSEPLEEYILWWGKQFGLDIDIAFAPYNQIFQQLLEEKSRSSIGREINLLLIRFEDWTRNLDLDDESKCAELEKNFRELERIIRHKEISSPYLVGLFPQSTHLSLSARQVSYLEDLNRRWKKLVEDTANFYLLDFTSLGQRYQIGEVFDPVMDKEGHLPFTHEYYAAMGTQTTRTICALVNSPFKVIVLDGDNTLWQGICGEDGPLGVKVAPPYLRLQRLMLQKHDQGMLLTLCSKNNPTDVWDVFEKNTGMLLTRDHFVDWKINWQPKSKNIKELAAQLNLGLDSFIFIDDSAVECAEVMTNCPEVLTLRLPANPEHIPLFLEHVWALDKMIVTPEDKTRTRMYRADKKRKEIREQAPSLTEFLSQLELKVSFNIMNSTQVDRVSQLTQRTNQFNLSTRRRREDEIIALAETPGTCSWVLEVCDRFGDYGLVGVIITMERSDYLFLDTFLLSCRVLGRGVEDVVLICLKKYLQECGLKGIKADYYPTPKNTPILEFLQRTWKLEEQAGNYTTYSLKEDLIPTAPAYAEICYRTTLPKPVQPKRERDNHQEISLDHIAVAVVEMEQARSFYRTIGYTCGEIITDHRQNVRLSMCQQPGYDNLELVSPIDRQSPTAALVEQNRDIPYHLCYRVRDIGQTLTALQEQEIPLEVVSDSKPAVLLDNKNVTFIQVRQVGLIEFLEDKDGKIGVTEEQTNRHNTLCIVMAEPGPAVKFYRFLGYTTVAKHEDNEKLIITMSKPGAGYIELTIPGERAGEERQFLQQNGPHPFRVVFYGSLSGQETEGFVSYPYTLFKPREQETGNEKQKKSVPGSALDPEIYGLDREDWLHRPHLLPLQYCTAGKLLQIFTYQVDKTRFGMGEYEEPQNELQRKLVQIWQDILKLEKIGINMSFFAAGGNSLKAILMVSKIGKELNTALTLKDVFNHPTIKKLAQYISRHAEKTGFFSIEPVEKKEYYVLSSAQQRLYFLQQIDKDGTAYNIFLSMILEGNLDKDKLERSIQGLIRGHESLRTSIEMIADEPAQRIHEHVEFEIEYYDSQVTGAGDRCRWKEAPFGQVLNTFGSRSPKSQELRAKSYISSFIRPFDLSRAPLLRVGLVKLLHTPTALRGHPSQEEKEGKYLFLVDMHHIISDAISIQILVQVFSALYAGKELPGIKLQYKDYSQWQNRERVSKKILEQGEYWKKEYEGEIPVLELPTDYARPVVRDFEGTSINFKINKETTRAIKALVQETQTTLYIVLLAFYTILLSKLSSREDIVIGTPVLGRRHADLEKIIGMLVNTLALRNYPTGKKKFTDFLGEVKERTLKSLENQGYPYEELVEKVAVTRDVSRNPLFDTMFVLQEIGTQKIDIPGLKLESYEYENKTSKFDLSLTAVEEEEKLLFTFEYSTKLFKRGTIKRFIVYFKNIVRSIVENKNQRIFDIEIIMEEERRRVLLDFNDTFDEYPKDKTIHQLFETQVEKSPDSIAVVGASNQGTFLKNRPLDPQKTFYYLTYHQLNESCNHLAGLIVERGVQPDNIVGIMVKRSVEMIIGIMAILKSGGAYLPIEPEHPWERIDYMLKDSSAQVLVVNNTSCASWLSFAPKALLNLSEGHHRNFPASQLPSFPTSLPYTLAYIIYTSGSTGKPKGVMVEHRSVINILSALQREYPLEGSDTYILKTSYLFDVSVTELFGWFLAGGRLAVLEKGGEKNPQSIIAAIRNWEVTHINFVPSMFNAFVEILNPKRTAELSSLKYIFLAGETLMPGLVEKFRQLNMNILLENIYGPTEGTVYAAKYSISAWKGIGSIPIGKPLQNIKLFILDKYDYMQPIGTAGELFIGGVGLARGYLNNPGLTAEKFDHDLWDYRDYHDKEAPFGQPMQSCNHASRQRHSHSPITPLPHYPIYYTGDLARWLLDGNIEFLGRLDHQVKIRGYRIELGEIESRLLMHEAVKDAVVVCRESKDGDKFLCAYIVGQQAEFREHLLNTLPDYMTPSYFMIIDKIPLTSSGKVDRKMLPEPTLKIGTTYTQPRDNVEMTLVEVWAEVLKVEKEKIGIDTSFFQLGGHSLNATIMASRIHKAFGAMISLANIYKMPTIRLQAESIKSAQKNAFSDIQPVEKREYYELSYNQKRLWIIHQTNPANTSYNIVGLFILPLHTEVEAVRKTLAQIGKKHESFRTSFKEKNGQPFQFIEDDIEIPLEVIDISVLEEKEKEMGWKAFMEIEKSTPFDLAQAPLIRVKLVKQESSWCFIFNMHHIISDDWSNEILKRDFLHCYDTYRAGREELGEILPLRYKDFASWQNRRILDSGLKEKALRYWLNKLEKGITPFNLPGDFERSKSNSTAAVYRVVVSNEIKERLHRLAAGNHTTPFIVMFSIFNWLLARFSGTTKILCGIISAGREHPWIKDIVGFFVNILPIIIQLNTEEKFNDFLRWIDTEITELFQYQSYPLELVFDELKTTYPEISVCFNMLNMQETLEEIELENLDLGHIKGTSEAKFDLVLYAAEYKKAVVLNWSYRENLFKPQTIEIIARGYTELLNAITSSGEEKTADKE